MPQNDFKAFATGENANVLTQDEYNELEAVTGGFTAGIAKSEELNKVWRQASTIVAVVASFMANETGRTFSITEIWTRSGKHYQRRY